MFCYNEYELRMTMIILISPAKTFKSRHDIPTTSLLFPHHTASIRNTILQYSYEAFREKLKLSDQLASYFYHLYHQQDMLLTPAIHAYDGIFYKAFDAASLNINEDKVYIVSAYYGLLRAYDGITPYRLDFNQMLVKQLSSFWKKPIKAYLVSHHSNDIWIDLTSKEFSTVLPADSHLYRIDFTGNKKLSSVELKKARGLMVRHLIKESITTLEALKLLKFDDFSYDEEMSTEHHFIFHKKN